MQIKTQKPTTQAIEAATRVARYNAEIIALLCWHKQYLERVAQLRQKHGIATNGFVDRTEKPDKTVSTAWRRQYNMIGSEWDYLDVPKPKHQLYRPLNPDFPVSSKMKKEDGKSREWLTDMEELTSQFKLSEHFRPHLERYVLYGERSAPAVNHQIRVSLTSGGRWRKSVQFIAFDHITATEWKLIHQAVQRFDNQLYNKRPRFRKNLQRDLEILERTQEKRKSNYDTDIQMAAYISAFSDLPEDKVTTQEDEKRAKQIRAARTRLNQLQEELFGTD